MRRLDTCQTYIRAAILMLLVLWLLISPRPVQAAGVVGDGTPGSCTEAALDAALAGGGTITFNCGPAPHIIFLTGQKSINDDTTIEGGDLITLSGGNATRLFDVGAVLFLRDIVLANGYFNGDGGAIRNNANGTLTLYNSTIQNSIATLSGGAIVSYGPMTITHSVLTNNSALNAGALYLRFAASKTTISGSVINGNRATGNYPDGGQGGAILLWDGPALTIQSSDVYSNTAGRFGGSLQNYRGDATLSNTTFKDNWALYSGGAIYNDDGGTATLTSVTMSGNSAKSGGGIRNRLGNLWLNDVTFSGNSATFGGGLDNDEYSNASLTNVTFSGNSAKWGGGIRNSYDSEVLLTNITLSGNNSEWPGGGLRNDGSVATLINVTFSGNSADMGSGDAIENYGFGSTVSIQNTLLTSDPASSNCSNSNEAPGVFISLGFNLSDDSSCTPFFTQPSDHTNVDPLLGPLTDNGGFTMTHLPQPGSPAIDAGQCLTKVSSDQRGVARPQGSACDIGAVEVEVQVYFPLYLPMVVH